MRFRLELFQVCKRRFLFRNPIAEISKTQELLNAGMDRVSSGGKQALLNNQQVLTGLLLLFYVFRPTAACLNVVGSSGAKEFVIFKWRM